MTWKRIKSEGIRNLAPLELLPGKKTSFFTGENGAGKTSILEAVCLLSTGRSFRNSQNINFINEDQPFGYSYGEWKDDANSIQKFGVRRRRDKNIEIHKNGEKQRNLEQINNCLALKVITPDVFSSLSGTSQQRRNLIDWSLFHVEHSFRQQRMLYNRLLKQRNAILRRYKSTPTDLKETTQELLYWDKEMSKQGSSLENQRKRNVQQLQEGIDHLAAWPGTWPHKKQIKVKYLRGWPAEKKLEDHLKESFHKDLKRGFTQYGPHRFDINLYLGKAKVTDVFSRGELKTLAVACQIIQIKQLIDKGMAVVVLIDDLFAELDYDHASWCLEQIHSLNKVQSFITGVSIPEEIKAQYSLKGMRWFHVEHGKIHNSK
ncbi:MAG TPA: DNA replication and repair protein RecF [Aeromonadales bacterium]|nr:DNA replication and repair protein RecF [Aeromonadales bacterium]